MKLAEDEDSHERKCLGYISITILTENLVTPVVLRLDGGFANDVPKADLPSNIQFGCYSYVLVAVVYGVIF
jgi:hypothetical protein